MVEARHHKKYAALTPSPLVADLNAFDILTDVSTKKPCTPCTSQATSEFITNRSCPGGKNKEGVFTSTRDLCKGCCYEVQDPGAQGKGGKNAGNYVDAASGKTYRCQYSFTVSKPLNKPDLTSGWRLFESRWSRNIHPDFVNFYK